MTRREHFRYGRHSNIPACCCAWFVALRFHLHKAPRLLALLNWIERPPHVDYVACPLCRVRRSFATIHLCGDSCPPRSARR